VMLHDKSPVILIVQLSFIVDIEMATMTTTAA
jgi:hypothetical protein